MPLAGGFLASKKEFNEELYYPLLLYFCKACFLVQTSNVVDKDTLFKKYYYHSSAIKTLVNHFTSIANDLSNACKFPQNTFVFEIGCNDGTFLSALRKNKFKVLGIDPAKNIVEPLMLKGFPVLNNYFTKQIANDIVIKYGKADVIFSSNTLAHIEDMHDVLEGIKVLLKIEGYLMFEVHYLGDLIQMVQYDMIYHEHQYYYSLTSLKKLLAMHDLEVFDVKHIPIHAGSMRYYVQHKSNKNRKITNVVNATLLKEKKVGLHKLEIYKQFANKVKKSKVDLLKLLSKLRLTNEKIYGYGASGRGTVIMNYCNIDNSLLEGIIDDAPAKLHAYTPGTHLLIRNNRILSTKKSPHYIVLFAWSFFDEIRKKSEKYLKDGGKFIIPLPKVKVVRYEK